MQTSTGPSTLLRKTLVPPETLQADCIQHFIDQAGQFERILTDSGFIKMRRLSGIELAGNSTAPGIIERYCQLSETAKQSQTALHREGRDITFRPGIRIGDYHCTLYTMADVEHLPAQCSSRKDYSPYSTDRNPFSIGFTTTLGPLLDCNHIYNQYIIIDDPRETIKKMELKKRRLRSMSAHSRENSLTHEAIDELLKENIAGQRRLVKAHFNIFSWTDDPADVKDQKSKISSAIAQMGGTPCLETTSAPLIWKAGIPGNAADLPRFATFDTFAEQAACFLTPETNYRSSISPFGIRLGDRLTGRPVHVDISDEPMRNNTISNRNKFVLGGSGSGKSYFINHLLRSYYEQGAHSIVVDIGGSYKGLCQLVGGFYFTYTEQAPICFNPFFNHNEQQDTEKKESIKTLLLALWKKSDEAFLRSEYVALSNALQLYYVHLSQHRQIFPCFDSFYEFLTDHFAPLLAKDRVKEKDFDIDNFLYVLRPFYKGGEYDYLLNATENLDLLHQPFIVFELDNIKDHPILFPVVTIIIMEAFINKMRNLPGTRKLIVIEEAWKAIARQGMSEYIRYLFKTVRKFFGEAIVVTQEVDDIISSPVVKQSIINNADCKILLDQSKFENKFEQLQELLGLSEKDKSLVLSLNKANEPNRRYKEVFIALGPSHSKVYRNEVSLEEHLTYTTEESEKIKVQAFAQRLGSIQQGIIALAAEIRGLQ